MSDAREQAIEIIRRGIASWQPWSDHPVTRATSIVDALWDAGWRPPEPAKPEWFVVLLQEWNGEWNLSWDGELFEERSDAEASLVFARESEWPVKLARVVPVSSPEAPSLQPKEPHHG